MSLDNIQVRLSVRDVVTQKKEEEEKETPVLKTVTPFFLGFEKKVDYYISKKFSGISWEILMPYDIQWECALVILDLFKKSYPKTINDPQVVQDMLGHLETCLSHYLKQTHTVSVKDLQKKKNQIVEVFEEALKKFFRLNQHVILAMSADFAMLNAIDLTIPDPQQKLASKENHETIVNFWKMISYDPQRLEILEEMCFKMLKTTRKVMFLLLKFHLTQEPAFRQKLGFEQFRKKLKEKIIGVFIAIDHQNEVALDLAETRSRREYYIIDYFHLQWVLQGVQIVNFIASKIFDKESVESLPKSTHYARAVLQFLFFDLTKDALLEDDLPNSAYFERKLFAFFEEKLRIYQDIADLGLVY